MMTGETESKPTAKADVAPIRSAGSPNPWPALGPGLVLVAAVYVWFVSVGTWTQWRQYTSLHDQLAKAFRAGQLSLRVAPSPALLALPDPYDPEARKDIPFVSDASVYNGKYYLYFGPVPALIIGLLETAAPVTIWDQYVTFGFTLGTFLMLAITGVRVWRRFFPSVPIWILAATVPILGLVSPFAWILSSRAAVHDASIAAGQFFMLAGTYAALVAVMDTPTPRSQSIAAGVFWALAAGSRITQVVPMAFLLVMFIAAISLKGRRSKGHAATTASIVGVLSPLLIGAVALGWYNLARFGSVFETGIRYQLALLPFQKSPGQVFSVQYMLQNAYNYLMMTPKLRYNFPYIWPRMGIRSPIIPGDHLPPLYFAEEITGLIFTAPLLLLCIFAIRGARRNHDSGIKGLGASAFRWLVVALGGWFLIGFGFFLTFFWASERYLLDFLPPALLLSAVGFWDMIQEATTKRWRWMVVLCGFGLGILSVLVSSLTAIALNAEDFRRLDPLFWQQLNNLFRP